MEHRDMQLAAQQSQNVHPQFLGLPIWHPNINTIYGKSAVRFWANVIGGIVGALFDIATNYVAIYAVLMVIMPFAPLRVVFALAGAILLGLADVFLFGAVRGIRKRDVLFIHLLFGAICLGGVAFYDLKFSADPLMQKADVPFYIAWTLSALSTLLEIQLFRLIEDVRKVRRQWRIDEKMERYVEPMFMGKHLMSDSIDTIYETPTDFHTYLWGGVFAALYKISAIMVVGVMPIVSKFIPPEGASIILTIFVSFIASVILSLIDFYTLSNVTMLFDKKIESAYAGFGMVVFVILSITMLYWIATPVMSGGFDALLSWALAGSASALQIIAMQTLIDWGDVKLEKTRAT